MLNCLVIKCCNTVRLGASDSRWRIPEFSDYLLYTFLYSFCVSCILLKDRYKKTEVNSF